jgi:competence protein ComEA
MKRIAVSFAAAALVMTLGVAAHAQDSTSTAPASPAPATESKPAHHAMHHHKGGTAAAAVDINSATKEQLMALPGVDDATADKIVAGRPFASRYDLVKKSIVTKAQYSKIKGKVTAKKAS